eukprot:COSAG02_NODE_23826_length_707_cov_0.827303_2_plen_96_part_00
MAKTNRCCNTCDLRVQYWRGEAMTDRSITVKKRRKADHDSNDLSLRACLGSGAWPFEFPQIDVAKAHFGIPVYVAKGKGQYAREDGWSRPSLATI